MNIQTNSVMRAVLIYDYIQKEKTLSVEDVMIEFGLNRSKTYFVLESLAQINLLTISSISPKDAKRKKKLYSINRSINFKRILSSIDVSILNTVSRSILVLIYLKEKKIISIDELATLLNIKNNIIYNDLAVLVKLNIAKVEKNDQALIKLGKPRQLYYLI